MADFIDDHSDQEDTDDEIQCLDDDKLPNINWRTRTRASKGSAPIEEDDLEITKEEDKHWLVIFLNVFLDISLLDFEIQVFSIVL